MKRATTLIIAAIGFLNSVVSLTATACTASSVGCGLTTSGPPPVLFDINMDEPADPTSVQASDLTVNGTPADNVVVINNNLTVEFTFNTSPVVLGVNTMHIGGRAFNCDSGPVAEFNCTFRYITSRPRPTPWPRPIPPQ